ncbi:MAG: DNA alkylation repair protein [Epsilonproteobacteria bacterium]|nr:DNA alkylation repair protein [Campylobacterota bacterium]
MSEKLLLKDQLFNRDKVTYIASEIKAVYPAFEKALFIEDVIAPFASLELKERIYHIRDMFTKYLPKEYEKATKILLDALPQPLDPHKTDDDFGDFIYAPYSEFVTQHGCTEASLAFSLQALREITKRFSVELAIRDFINHFPQQTLAMLQSCTHSTNYHERRLVSEGLRPKLPWAKKLTLDYRQTIPLLDNLYCDKTRYVTRSVANHLNDISKIDPALVVQTLKRWKASNKQNPKEMQFIINHALRTLIKKADSEALALLGYDTNPAIKLQHFKLSHEEINIGETLILYFDIKAIQESNLIIDYVMHFCTKRGTHTQKVHKIKKLSLQKDTIVKEEKRHHFKANMTTRNLNPGLHKVDLQINGKIYQSVEFLLKA